MGHLPLMALVKDGAYPRFMIGIPYELITGYRAEYSVVDLQSSGITKARAVMMKAIDH
jgi:hypothetical protein